MSAAKAIREKFGLTQLELAHFLGISKSQVAMSETHKRELPAAALRQLSEIEILLAANPAPAAKAAKPVDKKQIAKAIIQLQRHAHKHERLLHPEQQKAVHQQRAHTQAGTLLHFIKLHRKNKNLMPHQKTWLQLMEAKANDTLDRNNQHEQNIQQLIIGGLHYHIKEAKRLAAELEKQV